MSNLEAVRLSAQAAHFLAREAALIDRRAWPQWLALFDPDAVFWMPQRDVHGNVPDSPLDAVNLLYLEHRGALENRIARCTGGDSVANTPLPVTSHLVGSVLAEPVDGDRIVVQASFVVSATNPVRGMQQRWGRYEHLLRREGDDFRIVRKKVIALDEVFDGFIDVYLV